ncbi:hypothetical protein ACHQM5_028898 [Ranunculus cassubicifolius]
MKTTLLVSLVLFLFLAQFSEGLRFDHGLKGLLHQRIHEKKNIVTEDEAEIVSEDKHISSGRSRKLITNTPSTTSKVVNTQGSKVEPKQKHQHEENFSIKSSPISSSSSSPSSEQHGEATNGKYPDIIDIAGMDYSPARRKPPIHN